MESHSRVLASVCIQSSLSDLCLSAQGWAASRRCSRAQNPSVSQKEPWPLSTALSVTVLLTTSGGTDSILEKALSCWHLSSLMGKRKKADSQFTSIESAYVFSCTSETCGPVTLLCTFVQWVHSAPQPPAACTQTLGPHKAWPRASLIWKVFSLCSFWTHHALTFLTLLSPPPFSFSKSM